MATPVPMNMLFDSEAALPMTNGVVKATVYPDGPIVMLFLPCFFCMGCFITETIHTIIDTNLKKITVVRNKGLLFCLASPPVVYTFDQVANVGHQGSGVMQLREELVRPVIVMKDRTIIPVGGMFFMEKGGADAIGPKVLAYHKLFFGSSSDYTAPQLSTLKVLA